jgi:hypothetical protein
VNLVPDPLLLWKSGSARNQTRGLWICSQELWPLDQRGGPLTLYPRENSLRYRGLGGPQSRSGGYGDNRSLFSTRYRIPTPQTSSPWPSRTLSRQPTIWKERGLNFKGEQTGSRIKQTKKEERILHQGIIARYPIVAEIVNISERWCVSNSCALLWSYGSNLRHGETCRTCRYSASYTERPVTSFFATRC